MFDRPECVLVIVDGDLPSIVAAASAREAALGKAGGAVGGLVAGPVLWPGVDSRDQAKLDSIGKLGAILGLRVAHRRSQSAGPAGVDATRMLIDACTDAAAEGRTEVVWPAQFASKGPDAIDLDLVSRAVDRALLVTRLMAVDAATVGVPSLHVETPYVDLPDRQIADLAMDLSAPISTAWWWNKALDPARTRWMAALAAAGYRTESAVR